MVNSESGNALCNVKYDTLNVKIIGTEYINKKLHLGIVK